MNLKGKVALVTGAASGIGLDYIKIMFDNGLKHAAMLDFNLQAGAAAAEQLNRQFGADSTLFVACDASDMQQLEDDFNKAMNKFKKIDIVVNNAGIMRDSEWEKEIALNFAPFHEERTGVRVVTLCPSAMDTTLIADATSHTKHPEWLPEMKRFLASVPLQKGGEVRCTGTSLH
ncbi:15-hydroxyprostaglandin dehydrogenase [NAD(+)]-like [Bacillus rossius redtenbacheri]|uniref:15-hydroxyprostaglandin dehydrogenase [NAD(+)]-like n=1 Tax=Bacillus rossius redtenbacheri TaxID=93214 RepID=UPI002FDDF0CD